MRCYICCMWFYGIPTVCMICSTMAGDEFGTRWMKRSEVAKSIHRIIQCNPAASGKSIMQRQILQTYYRISRRCDWSSSCSCCCNHSLSPSGRRKRKETKEKRKKKKKSNGRRNSEANQGVTEKWHIVFL